MKNKTLSGRLSQYIAIIVVVGGLITFSLGRSLWSRIQLDQNIFWIAEEAHDQIQTMRKQELNFLFNDTTSDYFHANRTSSLIAQHQETQELLKNSFVDLTKLMDDSNQAQLTDIRRQHQRYAATFDEMVNGFLTLGYKDWGLEGQWRKTVHGLETIIDQFENFEMKASLLMLRRHEKDYLLRGDEKYIDKVKGEAENLRSLAQNSVSISNAIDNYLAAFDSYLAEQQVIGLTPDQGLRGKLAEDSESLSTFFGLLENEIIANKHKTENLAVILMSSAFVVVFSGILGVLVIAVRRATEPLKTLANNMSNMAEGDLAGNVEQTGYNDEIDQVIAALNATKESLRKQLAEIGDGTNTLAAASAEISATVSQMASSSSETAASISQTSATMEQLRQTSSAAASKAQSVADASEKTVTVSQEGERSVLETVQSIRDISIQMKSLAESVSTLSEHAQSIGSIISTVDDIAEQTNLLAVNAAVEAAKAGEQGKGFSVVAKEIRNLAEQSKQATSEVRTLLSDVQKATSHAVMTTEQAQKSVESTAGRSEAVGGTIKTLSKSIRDSAQSAAYITSSSKQQYASVDQVTAAMDAIREASLQSSTSIKQMEREAYNLQELGERLKTMVNHYKL